MFKHGKISLSILTMLLLLSNISFAFTVEICEMKMSSVCKCGTTDRNSSEMSGLASVNSKPCCTEEIKIISNHAEFETVKNVRTDFSLSFIPLQGPEVTPNPFFDNEQSGKLLIFYSPSPGIPVLNSSLLI